jgi:hypothetical protein
MRRSPLSLSRREWLTLSAAGVVGYSMSGWLENLAAAAAKNPARKRACILLWMSGGPSQMDTFDLKPGQANGGPYKETATRVPGIKISEHLPKLARHMKDMVLVRSMNTKEADHGRATYFLRTGRVPGGPIQYPPLGSFVSKELEQPDAELPGFVSVAPFRFLNSAAFSPGFLGPRYAPLIVGENANGPRPQAAGADIAQALRVQDIDLPGDVNAKRSESRLQMLDEMEHDFLAQHSSIAAESHRTAYRRAVTMMRSSAVKAFNLEDEPAKLRDAYGRNLFGQGCLLARRLVERGVPFIEITLDGWDTHQQNFEQVKRLSGNLDPAWSTLMTDLKDRGLLDSTLIVWMGEFGRTPRLNNNTGRDHWATGWSTVLAGGGIKGGQVVGKTSADGTTIEERKIEVADLLGTICLALGLDPRKQNQSNVGRPIRLVEPTAKPITEVVA